MLSSIQFANYILPFVTVPYIVRIIGPEKYGLISFAQAFVIYFSLFINYGFNLSATREISANRDNLELVSEIFSKVLSAKFVLFLIASLIYGILLFSVERLSNEYILFVLSYFTVIGDLTFPVWLYQGMEKLSYVALFNFLSKFLFTASIFAILSKESEYLLIPILFSISNASIGVFALYRAFKIFKVRYAIPSLNQVKLALKDAWLIFASTIVINLYTTSNTVILGFFASPDRVGYFSAAAKIISGFLALTLYPMNQVLYPYMSRLFYKNKKEAAIKLGKIILLVGISTLVVSIFIFLFSEMIVGIFLGSNFKPSTSVLKLLAFFPFVIGMSNLLGIQGLLNMKMDKEFFFVTGGGAILNFVLNILLIPAYKELGTAIAWLTTEIYITLTFALIYFVHKIDIGFQINLNKIGES